MLDKFLRGGGTENQLAYLIDNLDRSRFTPYVFNLHSRIETIEIDCPVYYLNLDGLSIRKPFRTIGVVRTIARFIRERDISILQVFFFDSRIVGTIAGRIAHVNKIVFCRRDQGWWHEPFMLGILRLMAKLSDYCLVNAKAVKSVVQSGERFPGDKIKIIHNGIELSPRSNSHAITKSAFSIPESAPVVGMVANLRPVKRFDRLLRIAATMKSKNSHFLVIGTGDLLPALQAQASSLGIADRVHFYHAVNGVYHLLQLFDIGVLTSESEGLSNVLIEYGLASIPAVAFDVGGNAEIIKDNETGFIVPDGDETLMAQRIDYLLSQPDLSRKFGNASRRHAIDKFNVETMVKRTEDFYEAILQGKVCF